MKKSELKQVIKAIVCEAKEIQKQRLMEAKKNAAKNKSNKKDLKEGILKMIKESIEAGVSEMARTKGALGKSNPNRVQPVKQTGKNYVAKGKEGMGRPKINEPEKTEDTGYSFSFVDPSGASVDLDPELPWYGTNQLNSYLESNVMSQVGELEAKLDPSVTSLLNAIKNKPETITSTDFVLKYDPSTKSVKVNPTK